MFNVWVGLLMQGNQDLLHLWLINMKLGGLYRLSNSLVLAIFHLSNLLLCILSSALFQSVSLISQVFLQAN
jgi:hypothetical protein